MNDKIPRATTARFALAVTLALMLSCGNGPEASRAQATPSADAAAAKLAVAGPYGEELAKKLQEAWNNRPPDYNPRTQHLNPDGTPKFTNRLFLETSPYLIQHAHNPTDWRPWGDEAFEEARRLGRPVLLSVGYSTCHWCHVMEEESFDNLEIARVINDLYIPIKVDREERPDIDAIYMSAVQALTGRGGWPMTVWLTPGRKPFYGGTYFPPRDGDRGARVGFLTLLRRLHDAYESQPDRVAESADKLTASIGEMLQPPAGGDVPGAAVLREAAKYYANRFDPQYGGTKRAPKFPSSLPIRFLLRHHRRTGDKKSLEMATLTLNKMAAGGMYDQVGGGFHRYSTDDRWLFPHFEKMLYDNALLATAYLEAHQVTGDAEFARVARDILHYVRRDMTSPQGAFYSATDADSLNPEGEREEGWFFTWTPAELEEALGKKLARVTAAYYYAVTPEGNFEGRNILHTPKPPDAVAKELGISADELLASIEQARQTLYNVRRNRPPPIRDEKILTAWNGLMISAFAQAAVVLGDQSYVATAAKAADFILANLRRDGRLLRSYKDGQARHNAYLDDYAFLTAALLDLYEASGEPRWLREAIALDRVLEEHYEDRQAGGFFMTSGDHEKLLAREKPRSDGAEPSGNSIAVMNLLRLHEFTTDDRYRQRAVKSFRAFNQILADSPAALSEMLLALDFHLDTPKEIIIVAPQSRAQAEPLLAKLRETFVPNRVLAVVPQPGRAGHEQLVPLIEGKTAIEGKPTAYVCERRVCELPTSDPEVFAAQIAKTEPLPAASHDTGRRGDAR